jgi:dipeptidyl aminopeptidase/acylaminoacyl peptidase
MYHFGISRRACARKADSGRWPLLFAICLFAFLCALPAQAIMRKVEPGETPKIGAGEALLLIAVDTDVEIVSLRIAREGANTDMRHMRELSEGRSSQLYVVPAGRYRWSMLTTRFLRYKLGKDDEFSFQVKAGAVNYPGDFIYRRINAFSGRTHVSNRGLAAMDWLEKTHSRLFREQRFEYTGRYPDPFPAIYREAIAKGRPAEARRPPLPESGVLPIAIDTLWKPGQLQMIELSPAGDLVAEVLAIKKPQPKNDKEKNASTAVDEASDDGDWVWVLNLIDLRKNEVVRLYESKKKMSRIDWVDGRTLAMSVGADWEPDAVVAINIIDGANGRSYDKVIVPRLGVILRTLPREPGHVLFASRSSAGKFMVHRVDLRTQAAIKRMGFDSGDRLNKGIEDATSWFADASGRLRLAFLTRKDGDRVMMHGQDKAFREVLNFDEDDTHFQPIALSADGERVYGLSDEGREQRDLVEFDPTTRSIAKTVFSKRGIDIAGVRFNKIGELIGVSYYQDGLVVSEYFDDDSRLVDRSLRAAFPGKAVSVLQRSHDAQQVILAVSGSERPTEVYHYDRASRRAALISETTPWLAERTFAQAQTLKVKSKDGFEIEAYLTLPANPNAAKRPLIVFPHGGPIGVRDDRFFDPEVQFMASLGYAVLQVNFRGSEGFGTAFRKAGEGNYGKAIEDDIDAAIAAALAQYPLDASRMCTAGSSYGGYSAMISTIRWQGRFRCAISMFGVSDLALFFTASDSGRSQEVREEMEKKIGNPNTDIDKMKANSPLYRTAELNVPLMLIHGTEDLRVDYEHTRRMIRMLDFAGRPPIVVELEGEGHGIEDAQQRRKAWGAIAGFLRTHLGDPLAVTKQAVTKQAATTQAATR